MKKIIAVVALTVVCSGVFAGTLKYEGSSTVGKFITDAKETYSASSFKIYTKTESGGCEKCIVAGKRDIGGVARDVKPGTLEKGVVATTVGKDAIAAIVHPSNSIDCLSLAQLSDIFTGKATNWKDVGGADLPIKVFKKMVLQGGTYKGKVVKPDAKIIKLVTKQKGAIGQISFAFITSNSKVKAVKPDGEGASTANANHPITLPLNIVTKGAPSGEA